MKWINVKKRLPKEFTHVPVKMKALPFPVMAIFDGNAWIMSGVLLHGRAGWRVDMWFPLPAPPEEFPE